MYLDLKFEPYQILGPSYLNVQIGEKEFPCCYIDKDSYIVSGRVETGLNFRLEDELYNLQIGRYSSLAENIEFFIDIDHDFNSVYQGEIREYASSVKGFKKRRKGEILIGSDCWIGSGATIMNGVIIHDGAVVAARSVVTKDVPPYSIVAGNPAKVIKMRFTEDEIDALKVIRWFDWNASELISAQEYLQGDIANFVNRYLPDAWTRLRGKIQGKPFFERQTKGRVYAYIVDDDVQAPSFKQVIGEFCKCFNHLDAQLVLYFPDCIPSKKASVEKVMQAIDEYSDVDSYMSLVYDDEAAIEAVINSADAYITSRSKYNLYAVSIAEMLDKELVSGFNRPIW